MRCIALVRTQCRVPDPDDKKGKIKFFNAQDVYDFPGIGEAPTNFANMEDEEYVLNMATANMGELLGANWDRDDLIEFAKEKYEADIKKFKKRESLVSAFIDARDRHIDASMKKRA